MTEEKKISRRGYAKYAAAGVIVVAGAAAGAYQATRQPPTPTTTYTPTTATTAPLDAHKKFAGTSINLVAYEITATLSMFDRFPDFEKETGMKINLEKADEATLREKSVLDYSTHTGQFDCANTEWWFIPEYARAGYLEPIDKYIEEMPDPVWFEGGKEDFIDVLLESNSYEGQLYQLPYWELSALLYVRKDLAMEYYGKIPRTMDEIVEAAEALTLDLDGDGKIDVYGITGRGSKDFDVVGSLAGWAWPYGGKILDEDKHPHVNDPEFVDAIELYVNSLKNFGPPGQASITWFEAEQLVLTGKAAMYLDTSDYGADFENPEISKVVGKIEYVPCPIGPAGKRAQWYFTDGISINKDSKNKEATWLFCQWATSKQLFLEELVNGERFDYSRKSALNDPRYEEMAEKAGKLDYLKAMREAFMYIEPDFWPHVPEFVEIGTALTTEVSKAIAGEITTKRALDAAQESIDKIMRRAGYY